MRRATDGSPIGQSPDGLDEAVPDLPTLVADPGGQGENDTRRRYAQPLLVLMVLVGLVLVSACANVANLFLARGIARRPEIALRLALGANRRRLVRQLFVESLVVAARGAALGGMFAWWGRGLLLALHPFGTASVVLDMPLDARVLGFTVVATLGTALLFGLAPALGATGSISARSSRAARVSLGRRGGARLAQTLMVVQIALSLVLLVSTGLFVRTLANLEHVDAGFNRRDLVVFRIDATSAGYTRDQYRRAAGSHPGAARASARRARGDVLQRGAAVRRPAEQAHRCARPHAATGRVDDRQHQRPRAQFLCRDAAAARARPRLRRS